MLYQYGAGQSGLFICRLINTSSEIFLVIIDKHFRLAIINIENGFLHLGSNA
jgi:hypothetical protein